MLEPLQPEARLTVGGDSARAGDRDGGCVRDRTWGLTVFLLALLPSLYAVWGVPWFLTQDGPAHLYNAQILVDSSRPDSPFRPFYKVRWEPLPNWTGHLALMGSLLVLPAWAADRLLTTLTLAGFAASILWLRHRVVGWRGMPLAALLAVLLALNVTWLLGFTSFLLGACLFPITLGVWWGGRERFSAGRAVAIGVLAVLGYFSHLVSLGLTVVGLATLAALTPGPRRLARALATAVGLLPLVPLGLVYLRLSKRGGPMHVEWRHLTNPASLRSWAEQMAWADPISLCRKVLLPFREDASASFVLLAPVFWITIALLLAGLATARSGIPSERRGWGGLAALLLLGGLVAPDTFGASHGFYLPQRVVLLGLVALVPFLELGTKDWVGRLSAAALVIAVSVQSAFVLEYARASDRVAVAIERAKGAVGRRQRVATLLNMSRTRFRSNPLLHVDSLLGIDTGNILWSNYETRYYYFPVQFRADKDHRLDSYDLEQVDLMDEPGDAEKRAETWRRLLEAHHRTIDVLVVWGDDPALSAIHRAWFEPVLDDRDVHVLRHRPAS